MRRLSNDEHLLLALLGADSMTLQALVESSRRTGLIPSAPFLELIKTCLESGIIAGYRDGYVGYFSNNIGNCKDIEASDYFRWLPVWIIAGFEHKVRMQQH